MHCRTVIYCLSATPLVAALATGCASALQAAPRAHVEVVAADGPTRAGWPIQAAIPFAPGVLREPEKLRLSSGGAALPAQARATGRWPDGSVRWAMLEWQADLEPGRMLRFEAGPGQPAAANRRVVVVDEPDRVRVDTGSLRFTVPRSAPGLLTDVSVGGHTVLAGPAKAFMTIAGHRVDATAPGSVTVKEPGPLRARIEVRGQYGANYDYVVRIDAHAGHSFLRILHTFEQHGPEAYDTVSQIALELPVDLPAPASYRVGLESGPGREGTLPEAGLAVVQEDNDTVAVGGERQAGKAAGWADLYGADAGVAVAARYFWQEYPQSLALRPGRLTYNMWAPEAAPARVGMGAAKTHEFVVYFHGPSPPSARLLDSIARPVVGRLDPAWIAATGALRNLPPSSARLHGFLRRLGEGYERSLATARSERWDEAGGANCPGDHAAERPRRGFFGMFNWGDWNFPGYHDTTKGCDSWGNLEYDLPQVLALAYASTGDPKYFDGLVAGARHFMDVDRVHFNRKRPDWVGMNYPKNPEHFSLAVGGVDLGHTWTEGLLSYYFLTADARGLVAARGIADYLVRRLDKVLVLGNPRQWGWPQIALVAAYEANGEVSYRKAALEYAERGMAAHRPDKVDHWKVGILAESLAYTHSVTGSASIREWLRNYAVAVKRRRAREKIDPRFLPALAYAGRLFGKPAWTRAAVDEVRNLQFGRWAKPFTIAGRVGFSILAQPNGPGEHVTQSKRKGGT